jgi:serine protease Do
MVSTTPVGTTLNVSVLRNHQHENFKVVVGDLAQIFPDRFGNGGDESVNRHEGTTVSFGMSIVNLNERQRQTLGIKQTGGVQVTEVEPNSFAEDINLAPNDVILSINNQPVNSTDDVKRLQQTLKPGDAVAFKILRKQGRNGDWQSSFVAGTLR